MNAQGMFESWLNEVLADSAKVEKASKMERQRLIQEAFDIERLAPQVLQKGWRQLNELEKAEFETALVSSIARELGRWMPNIDQSPSVGHLSLIAKDVRERFTKLTYTLDATGNGDKFTLFMLKQPDRSWKITNIKSGGESLLRRYYTKCDDAVDDYSFRYLIAELRDDGYVALEDFESSKPGSLPAHWTWKSKDEDKHKPYVVIEENGNRYLAADDSGESVILGKDVRWNLKKYRYVSFRWRGRHMPTGGDERYGRTNDSAAAVYFIFKKKFGLIPESVKYVWSTTLPVGVATRRSGTGRPWNVVAESGDEHLGVWRTYVFDAYEAYKKTFGSEPPDKAIGIGILSDANSTHSKAHADYDDIRALKHAVAGSGVAKFLDAE